MVDIVIAGAGPAGRALGAACADLGLSVTLIDPAPQRPWRATYGLWLDELPGLPDRVIATCAETVLVVTDSGQRRLTDRSYCVLDNAALRAELARPDIVQHTGRVRAVEHSGSGCTVLLADGRSIEAGLFVDASGTGRWRRGSSPAVGHCSEAAAGTRLGSAGTDRCGARRQSAAQTAFGVVLPSTAARRYVAPGEAILMDWRPVEQVGRTPSFCYAVPLGDDEVLIEETCLAGRPALSFGELRNRLSRRMAGHGVDLSGVRRRERVRIDLDRPAATTARTMSFGAAAGLVHPASGYGLATALRLVPAMATALAAGVRSGPSAVTRAARHVLWPPKARMVHALRRYGLEVLLTLDRAESSEFFTSFFRIPTDVRTSYLSDREDVLGTAKAMVAVLAGSGPSLALRMTTGGRFAATVRASDGRHRL
ncbi:lycopene cyclase family protein [Actinoalloteichus hymeniacidonis]|uniref:2-polyprenyl-6-methoxyphenol hydroxylase-like oxidoreductase n=1 Tax=Actinoalloteichus hymeniacidonis TaxID=340345 RepID=A0AAC9HRJ5_9PSEU|nr:lycopene cyclase family protein [Actinoalloteichus hymeniacidonis]AOS63185.1 2-polyprenyl-6-methoxyphenol hydroxylase-like oxidoreductase [Actinoalloteichus hymeniacidonis]MBB5908778.1 lycopene beta-cyclase [Actinoalloteichus hymeniacidonis]